MSLTIQVTDQVIAIAAAVIAFAALVVAVWEGVMSRRHNRLSVMPQLSIRHHLYGSKGAYGLTVSNDGLGTALVTHCALEIDGESMKEKEGNGWNTGITKLGLHKFELGYYAIVAPDVIRPGETVWLLSIPATNEMKRHIAEIKGAFNRLNVCISYESMYGDKKLATYQR